MSNYVFCSEGDKGRKEIKKVWERSDDRKGK
jgi:hypothetical protein